jgi:hypothetical protein
MSPASYLTAPPRVAAPIVAPPGSEDTVVTMAGMALLAWISLLFLVVAVVGSVSLATVRGLRTWRAVRAFSGATTGALDDVSRIAAEAERHAVSLSEGNARLGAAVTRLQSSLAQLAILRSAASDARAVFDVRSVFPRK